MKWGEKMDVNNINKTNAYGKNGRIPQKQLGKNDFFKILSAQLQFQDPLSGGDNTEYVAQLAQFSALEQSQNLNNSIEHLIYFQNAQYGSQLIGKQVSLDGGDEIITGVVEKTRMIDGEVRILIDGKSYSLYQILQVEEAGEVVEDEVKEPNEPDQEDK